MVHVGIIIWGMLVISVLGQSIVLAHYAQRTWVGAFRGAWHLYGHSHGNLPPFSRSMDVGVDAHDYAPLSFEQVKERMAAAAEFFERPMTVSRQPE